jgi:uncharacterized protein YjdB/subtilisin family serine protease
LGYAEVQATADILRTRFVDYDLTSSKPISVIVELAGEPLAVIEESLHNQGVVVTQAMQGSLLQRLDTKRAQVMDALRGAGIAATTRHSYALTFNGIAMQVPANQVKKLLSIPGIIDVFPDIEMQATGLEHSLPAIRAQQAWAIPPGLSGSGILVAVLDTGADYMHPDLGGGIGPTFKVIGGTDFVDDDNDPMERKNDPGINPATGRDWNTSHGTHVAATVVAVAPEASLYIIRVLGRGGSGSSSDVMAGIERAVQVGADVANMSLGAALAHPDSPWARAVDNAVRAGVVFTVSAGNSGPGERTTGTYANTRLGIAVGWADTTPKPLVLPQGGTAPFVGGLMTFSPALAPLGTPVEFVSVGLGNVPADFRDAGGNSLVTGRIALMERGGAAFAVKSRNARDAGAIGAIIFNNVAGTFGGTLGDNQLGDIPTLSLSREDGLVLRAMAAGTRFVTFSMGEHHLMSPSSSRGPDALLGILPHVSAPGQNITAAYPFPGTDGSHVSGAFQRVAGPGNPWFGTISGTSMAAPHVAGAAALMLQARPTLTPEQIRLGLMNTASNMVNIDGRSFRPIDQGAGMINIHHAITAGLRVAPGMLNFREVTVGETQAMLNLESLRTTSAVFRTRVEKFNPAHAYEVLVPTQVTVGAGARVNVPVALFVDAALPLSVPGTSDYTGYIVLENVANPADSYRVPFFFVNGQVVSQVTATPDAFSPNGDGVQDTTTISFVLGRAAHATRIMLNGFLPVVPDGFTYHVAIATFGPLQPGRYSFVWNGAAPTGFTSPDRFGQINVQVQPTSGAAWTPALSASPTISPGFARLQIDTTPPAFHNVTPAIDTTTANRVRVRGAVDDLLISNVMSDGGSVWVNDQLVPIRSGNMPIPPAPAGAVWDWATFESQSITATLADNNTATLRARDAAGNERTQTLNFTGLVVNNPTATTVLATTTEVRVQGTVVLGMTLTINGAPATYDAFGRFDVTLPLTFGTNTFTVTAGVPAWGAAFTPISRQFTVERPIPVAGIMVTPPSAELRVGGTVQLTATIAPPTATVQTVTWLSSDTAVATVSPTGLVTAVGLGTATITARSTDGNLAANASITVVPTPVTAISIAPLTPNLHRGLTLQMTATLTPADATNRAVTFTSSHPAVATVSATGLVTSVALGTTTITARAADGGLTASTVVTVVPPIRVTGITLTPAAHTLERGATVQLAPTILPANATNRAVAWLSTNTSVATVSGTGLVTAVAPGVAHIAATTVDGHRTAVVTITVVPPAGVIPVTGVTVSPVTATLSIGGNVQLTATVLPATATNRAVTWASTNAAVATVDATGLVTAIAAGSAQITVTTVDGQHSAVSSIVVTPVAAGVRVTGVTLTPTTSTLAVGATAQLTATVLPANATNRAVTWLSTAPTIASVSAVGLVTAVAPGTAQIAVMTADGGHVALATVVVTPADGVVPVTGVSLTPTTATVTVGGAVQLTAAVAPANATNRTVTWSSSNTAWATVSATGLVTGMATGTVTITATTADGNHTATAVITVLAPVGVVRVTGVTLTPAMHTLAVGGTVTLVPVVLPLHATNRAVTWLSTNPAAVRVCANGIVTAVAPGLSHIVVTTVDGSRTAVVTVVVTAAIP